MAKGKKEDQKTLFGEHDLVYNVLQTDLTLLNENISNGYKRIERIQEQIKQWEERREEVLKANQIVEKHRRAAEASKVEEERAEDQENTDAAEEEEETKEVETPEEETPY